MLDTIVKLLRSGIRSSWREAFDFSDDPHSDIQPEYLITMNIARAFLEQSNAKIRIEQNTRGLGFQVSTSKKKLGLTRHGKVDVFVESASPRGNVYVEVKRYVSGFAEIHDDLVRCSELVKAGRGNRYYISACVFLFRAGTSPILKKMHESLQRRYKDLDRKLIKFASCNGVEVTRDSFYLLSEGFEDENSAQELDSAGCPEYESIVPHVTEGVVILLLRDCRDGLSDEVDPVGKNAELSAILPIENDGDYRVDTERDF